MSYSLFDGKLDEDESSGFTPFTGRLDEPTPTVDEAAESQAARDAVLAGRKRRAPAPATQPSKPGLIAQAASDLLDWAKTPFVPERSVMDSIPPELQNKPLIEQRGGPVTAEYAEGVRRGLEVANPATRMIAAGQDGVRGSVAKTQLEKVRAVENSPSQTVRQAAGSMKDRAEGYVAQGESFETARVRALSDMLAGRFAGQIQTADTPYDESLSDMVVRRSGDLGLSAAQVPAEIIKGIADITQLATAGMIGGDLSAGMAEVNRKIGDAKSTGAKIQDAEFDRLMKSDSATGGAVLNYLLNNPGLLIEKALPSAGSMALPMASAGIAGRLASTAKWLQALPAAERAAAVRSVQEAVVVATGAAQNAAETFTSTKGDLGDKYSAAAISAVGSLLAGKVTGGGAEGALVRGATPGLRGLGQKAAAAGAVVGKEFGQEFGEGFSNTIGQQFGETGAINPREAIKQGMVEGAMGAVIGGGVAGAQALAPARENRPQPVAPLMTDAANVAPAGPAPTVVAPIAREMPPDLKPDVVSYTPAGSLSAQMGLTPIVVPAAAPAGASDTEREFGLDALRMPGATAPAAAAPAPLPTPTAGTAPTDPTSVWFGRRGDGYQTEADAQQAIAGRQKREPALAWSVEQMPSGKFRLAGYPATAAGEAAVTPGNRAAKAPAPAEATTTPAEGQQAAGAPAAPAGWGTVETETPQPQPERFPGAKEGEDWQAFPPESGALGVPRAEMPQVKAEARGALTFFLRARGIDTAAETVPASSLKPTQAEYSPEKVRAAAARKGGDRAILVSSDGYVVDGHHQWMAAREAGEDVKVRRLDAPIAELLPVVREFPSATTAEGATSGQQSGAAGLGMAGESGQGVQGDVVGGVGGVGSGAAQPGRAGVAPGRAPALSRAEADGVQQDLVKLQDIRLRSGEATRLEVVEPSATRNAALATRIAQVFRAPLYFIRDRNKRARFNAVRMQSGRILISADADAPAVALTMHEVGHSLPRDIKLKMIAAVKATMKPGARERFLGQFKSYEKLSAEKQDEELVMRAIEQDAQNAGFWRKLAEKMGDSEFGKLAREILKTLDRLLAGFRKEDSSEFVADIEAFRDAVASAYAEAEARAIGAAAQPDGDQAEQASERRQSLARRLQERGEYAESKEDARRMLDEGYEMYVAHEMDERPVRVRRAGQFEGYQPEQIIGIPPETKASERREPSPVQSGESVVDGIMFSDRRRSLEDVPEMDFADLVGKRVVGIKADLTDAGRSFTGIDGSELQFPVELMGGPGYPRLPESWKDKLIWAVRGGGTLSKILNKVMESDYIIVHAMNDRSHLTNTTVSQGYIDLVRAYLRDGRISNENLLALDAIVRSESNKASFPDFPGFESPTIAAYIDALSFDRRGALATILEKKEAQTHGLPNLDKYRRSVLDAEYAGYRQGDAMLALKVDKSNPTIKLGENGTKLHPSYPLALRGEVVGKLRKGVNYELIYEDYFRDTVPKFKNGMDGAWYGFDRSMPVQMITPEIADRVSPGKYKAIASARQAQAALALANESWLVSGKTKANGGVSVQEFVDALAANDGSPALTLYTAKEVNAGIKAKTFSVYQLGTEGGDKGLQVFFGLKRGTPWYKGIIDAEVSDNEVELVSVTNNELGAPGIGIPAIITKAIQEGATVLDAYAVKSDRFPNGFLPEVYGQFGFEEIGRIPFDEQYVVEKTEGMTDDEHARLTKLKLADLKSFWKSGGWKEGKGYPDVVVMRWSGKDEDRTGAVGRYVREGQTGVSAGVVDHLGAAAEDDREQRDRPGAEGGGAGRADGGEARRDQGAGNAAPVVRRAYGSIQELAELNDREIQNLGLDPKEVARLRDRLAEGAIVASLTSVVQFSEQRAAPADRIRWRKLADVKAELSLDKIPAHVTPFATFMRDMATKAQNGGLTARDVIKAYTIARSSMNRQAVATSKVRAAGLQLPAEFSDPSVRPEGAFGFWLLSPMGQQYLNAAEVGITDEAAIADAVDVMAPFGTQNVLGGDLQRAASGELHKRLPAMTAAIVKAAGGKNAVKDWQEATADLYGIRAAKQGFLGSLLGFGQLPTFDARQINLNVKPQTRKDTLQALGSTRSREVVAKLARRMDALQLSVDPQFSPFYRHLAHHAVWDAVGRTQTTHADVIDAMVQASEQRRADVSPLGLYSELARAIERGPGSAMKDQWKAYIKGLTSKGVKQEEIVWSGIEEWLDLQQGKVPRASVVEYLRANGVQVEETALGQKNWRTSGKSDDDLRSMSDEDLRAEYRAVRGYDPIVYDEPMSRDAIIDELENALPEDVSDTKYGSYTLPGGENYRELLLTLPPRSTQQMSPRNLYTLMEQRIVEYAKQQRAERGDMFATERELANILEDPWAYDELVDFEGIIPKNVDYRVSHSRREVEVYGLNADRFRSSHWDEENVLAHIRMNDRVDTTGAKVLFVEELQSDWAQEGRKKGFDKPPMKGEVRVQEGYDPAAADMFEPEDTGAQTWAVYWEDGTFSGGYATREQAEARLQSAASQKAGGVPSAPFVKTTDSWLQLALKRVIAKAVEEGADKVAFVTGSQAAERFDLSKTVDSIVVKPKPAGVRRVAITMRGGSTIVLDADPDGVVGNVSNSNAALAGKPLDEVVGKDMAEKIMATAGEQTFAGLDIKVGGDGMKAFYDTIVPTAINKMLKKLGGGKVDQIAISNSVYRDQLNSFTIVARDAVVFQSRTRDRAEERLRIIGDMYPDAKIVEDSGVLEQPGFEITPAMRDAVEQGLPLFSEQRDTSRGGSPFSGWGRTTTGVDRAAPRPSLELTKLVEQLDDGKITSDEFEIKVRMLTGRIVGNARDKQNRRDSADRVRGADIVREKLLAARRRGDIEYEDAEFAMWLLGRKPELADDLGASVRTPPENARGVSGRYSPAARVLFLFKQQSNPDTAVHEILHHAERMMPQAAQDGIATEWSKQFARAYLDAPQSTRDALNDVLGQLVSTSIIGQQKVVDHFSNGRLQYDAHYQLVNPSEFWAVNATRIMSGRYQAQGSWIGMARVWMREMIQRARGLFRLRSDSPVLRGLDAVMNGDASFVSQRMLSERLGMLNQVASDIESEINGVEYEGFMFSERRDPPPKKTVKAFKLFRMDSRKPGQLFPLFVDANTPVPMGTWLDADVGAAAPPTKTGVPQVKSKIGALSFRPGWHAGDLPIATHIGGDRRMRVDPETRKSRMMPTARPADQVWAEIEMSADVDWQAEADRRGTNARGQLIAKNAEIKDGVPRDGYYRYKTNPNMTGNWLIGGSIKVTRILSDDKVKAINDAAGVADLPRNEPLDLARFGFDEPMFSAPRATGWRDEAGRLQFKPGALAYGYAADIANRVLDKVGLKPIDRDLARAMRQMKTEIEAARERTVAVAGKLSELSPDERQMISDVIEGELRAGVTPPQRVLDIAASMQSIMGEQTQELIRLGMLDANSAQRWEGKYLPRFYEKQFKDEAAGWLKAAKELLSRKKTMQGIGGSNLKARGLFRDVPVEELEQWVANGWEERDPKFDPNKDDTIRIWRDFSRVEREDMGEIRDAMFRFVMGYTKAQKDIALGRLYERLADTIASRSEREGYVFVPDTTIDGTNAKRYGKLAGMWVPSEVLDHLRAADTSEQNEALKLYRKAMSMWKEGKTVLNPVSHANNVISNLTMAHFAGVSYWDQHKYVRAAIDLAKDAPAVQEARAAGLFGGTFTQAEMLEMLPPELQQLANMSESKAAKAVDTAWNVASWFLRKPMGKAYEMEDLFFRYLIYSDARARGLETQDAIDYAQQFIFTYDDLPRTARGIRDFALPFFAYTYKSVPVLARTALTHPWRMAAPAAILYTVNALMYAIAQADADDGEDDTLTSIIGRYFNDPSFRERARMLEANERKSLPSWMKGYTALLTPKAIRLGMDDVTNLPMFLDVARMFPGGDLLDATNNAGGVALLQPITPSHPLLTTAMAMLGNRDLFFGKDVVDKTMTDGEAAAARGKWLWQQFMPAIAIGNYHFDRAMNVIASATGEPMSVGPFEWTGFGRDGLPVQPSLAAMQTVGIKARPIDLEMSEQIDESQKKALIRELDAAMRRIDRLEDRRAITPQAGDREREKLDEKKARLKEGLDINGRQKN